MPGEEHQRSLPAWLAWLLPLVVYALLVRYTWPQIGDDTFIFLRYAERLAVGDPTFSDGGPAVEGYSSPLWAWMLVLGVWLGAPLVGFAKALGVLWGALAVAAVVELGRSLGLTPGRNALAGSLFAATAGLLFWAPSGMETPLVAALVAWTAAGLADGSPEGRNRWVAGAACLGVARPEGPGLVVVALVLAAWRQGRLPRPVAGVTALAPGLLWVLLRLGVYGALFPNTFYAKATGGAWQLLAGLVYASGPLAMALLLLVGVGREKLPRGPLVVLGWAGVLLAIVVAGGGDWMWYGRLVVPVYAVLLPVLVRAGSVATDGIGRGIAVGAGVLWLQAAARPLWVLGALTGGQLPEIARQEGEMTPAFRILAEELRASWPPETLAAVDHAGAFPYYSGFRVLDMTGLNDPHIARVPGELHGKYDVPYVLRNHPELVMLNTRHAPDVDERTRQHGYWVGQDALVDHPAFQRCYRLLDGDTSWRWIRVPRSWFLVYALEPDGAACIDALIDPASGAAPAR